MSETKNILTRFFSHVETYFFSYPHTKFKKNHLTLRPKSLIPLIKAGIYKHRSIIGKMYGLGWAEKNFFSKFALGYYKKDVDTCENEDVKIWVNLDKIFPTRKPYENGNFRLKFGQIQAIPHFSPTTVFSVGYLPYSSSSLIFQSM